jgi:hypothetical protein
MPAAIVSGGLAQAATPRSRRRGGADAQRARGRGGGVSGRHRAARGDHQRAGAGGPRPRGGELHARRDVGGAAPAAAPRPGGAGASRPRCAVRGRRANRDAQARRSGAPEARGLVGRPWRCCWRWPGPCGRSRRAWRRSSARRCRTRRAGCGEEAGPGAEAVEEAPAGRRTRRAAAVLEDSEWRAAYAWQPAWVQHPVAVTAVGVPELLRGLAAGATPGATPLRGAVTVGPRTAVMLRLEALGVARVRLEGGGDGPLRFLRVSGEAGAAWTAAEEQPMKLSPGTWLLEQPPGGALVLAGGGAAGAAGGARDGRAAHRRSDLGARDRGGGGVGDGGRAGAAAAGGARGGGGAARAAGRRPDRGGDRRGTRGRRRCWRRWRRGGRRRRSSGSTRCAGRSAPPLRSSSGRGCCRARRRWRGRPVGSGSAGRRGRCGADRAGRAVDRGAQRRGGGEGAVRVEASGRTLAQARLLRPVAGREEGEEGLAEGTGGAGAKGLAEGTGGAGKGLAEGTGEAGKGLAEGTGGAGAKGLAEGTGGVGATRLAEGTGGSGDGALRPGGAGPELARAAGGGAGRRTVTSAAAAADGAGPEAAIGSRLATALGRAGRAAGGAAGGAGAGQPRLHDRPDGGGRGAAAAGRSAQRDRRRRAARGGRGGAAAARARALAGSARRGRGWSTRCWRALEGRAGSDAHGRGGEPGAGADARSCVAAEAAGLDARGAGRPGADAGARARRVDAPGRWPGGRASGGSTCSKGQVRLRWRGRWSGRVRRRRRSRCWRGWRGRSAGRRWRCAARRWRCSSWRGGGRRSTRGCARSTATTGARARAGRRCGPTRGGAAWTWIEPWATSAERTPGTPRAVALAGRGRAATLIAPATPDGRRCCACMCSCRGAGGELSGGTGAGELSEGTGDAGVSIAVGRALWHGARWPG